MKRILAAVFLALAAFAAGAEERAIARVDVIDDTGRVRSTSEWRGIPTILVPMYARCPLACPRIIASMKHSIAEAKTAPQSYRVVLFSFDARDTVADLRRVRERHRIPLSWTIATAKPADIRRLMDSVGYYYAETNGLYAHRNLAMSLTPDLELAKTFYAIDSTGATIDEALGIARGRRDWLGQFGGIALAGLLFVCILSAVYLVVLIGQRKPAAA